MVLKMGQSVPSLTLCTIPNHKEGADTPQSPAAIQRDLKRLQIQAQQEPHEVQHGQMRSPLHLRTNDPMDQHQFCREGPAGH